jgi:hypothetical protein
VVNVSSHIQRPGIVWPRAASSPREAEAQKVESLLSCRTHMHSYIRIQVSFIDFFFTDMHAYIRIRAGIAGYARAYPAYPVDPPRAVSIIFRALGQVRHRGSGNLIMLLLTRDNL